MRMPEKNARGGTSQFATPLQTPNDQIKEDKQSELVARMDEKLI
jgi:hypothetical protein